MRIDEKGWTVSEVPVSSTALIENREADLGLPYSIEGGDPVRKEDIKQRSDQARRPGIHLGLQAASLLIEDTDNNN